MGEMRERMLRGELYVAEDSENAAEFVRVQDWFAPLGLVDSYRVRDART